MSYRPTSRQSHRFLTELWAAGSPKLQIVSSSWKSMMEQERLDRSYSTFIQELHRQILKVNSSAQFERGISPLVFWPGVIVFVAAAFGLAALIARALQAGATTSAAIVGAFLLLYLLAGRQFFSAESAGHLSAGCDSCRCHAIGMITPR